MCRGVWYLCVRKNSERLLVAEAPHCLVQIFHAAFSMSILSLKWLAWWRVIALIVIFVMLLIMLEHNMLLSNDAVIGCSIQQKINCIAVPLSTVIAIHLRYQWEIPLKAFDMVEYEARFALTFLERCKHRSSQCVRICFIWKPQAVRNNLIIEIDCTSAFVKRLLIVSLDDYFIPLPSYNSLLFSSTYLRSFLLYASDWSQLSI